MSSTNTTYASTASASKTDMLVTRFINRLKSASGLSSRMDDYGIYYVHKETEEVLKEAKSRLIRENETRAEMLEKLKELARLHDDETLLTPSGETESKKPTRRYTLKCLLRSDLPRIPKPQSFTDDDAEYEDLTFHTATVIQREVSSISRAWSNGIVYDIRTRWPAALDDLQSPKISQVSSFEDIQKLLDEVSESSVDVRERDEEELVEQPVEPSWSFDVVRNLGEHNIPEAHGILKEEDLDLEEAANQLPADTHAAYDGHKRAQPKRLALEENEEIQRKPGHDYMTLIIRGELAPMDFDYENLTFFPLDADEEANQSFINSAMIYGVDCIVIEPPGLADETASQVSLYTLTYSMIGTYLSWSICLVGLTKMHDRRMTMVGLINVWLLKEFEEWVDSDPIHNYRNIDYQNITDIETVLSVFDPAGSRAKYGRVIFKDSRIKARRKMILNTLVMCQLAFISFKFLYSMFKRYNL